MAASVRHARWHCEVVLLAAPVIGALAVAVDLYMALLSDGAEASA